VNVQSDFCLVFEADSFGQCSKIFSQISAPLIEWRLRDSNSVVSLKRLSPNPSPHLSPRRGYPANQRRPVFTVVLSWFGCLSASPTSVGFMARTAAVCVEAVLAKNLPHRSRENEFTGGRVKFLCKSSFFKFAMRRSPHLSLDFELGNEVINAHTTRATVFRTESQEHFQLQPARTRGWGFPII